MELNIKQSKQVFCIAEGFFTIWAINYTSIKKEKKKSFLTYYKKKKKKCGLSTALLFWRTVFREIYRGIGPVGSKGTSEVIWA